MKEFRVEVGEDCIVGAAIHDGHEIRPEVARLMGLTENERLREEDPFTAIWAAIAGTRIIGVRSRFEVDLNRPRDKAVYRTANDAWGLNVWKCTPDERLIADSLAIYDRFYDHVHSTISDLLLVHPRIVVLDLHSYNHRRDGADKPAANAVDNPEVNIGTGTMNRRYWSSLVDRLMVDLKRFEFQGRRLDVRENVKFRGGHFGAWLHQTFPGRVCAPAIEFKKFFMDEWTGKPCPDATEAIRCLLEFAIPGVREQLQSMNSGKDLIPVKHEYEFREKRRTG